MGGEQLLSYMMPLNSYTATFRPKPFGSESYLHKSMIANNTFVIMPVCAFVSVLVRVTVLAADCSPLGSRLHTLIHQPHYCFCTSYKHPRGMIHHLRNHRHRLCVCACVSDTLNCVEMEQMMKWSHWTIQLSVYAWLFNHECHCFAIPPSEHTACHWDSDPRHSKTNWSSLPQPAILLINKRHLHFKKPMGQKWETMSLMDKVNGQKRLGLPPFSSQTSTLACLFEGLSKAFALGHFLTSGKIHQG